MKTTNILLGIVIVINIVLLTIVADIDVILIEHTQPTETQPIQQVQYIT